MKEKNKIIAIIIVLVVLLLTSIVIYVKKVLIPKKNISDYGYEIMGVYKDPSVELKEKTLSIEGSEYIMKFQGELPVSNVTSTIKNIFIEKIPNILDKCKDMEENQLQEYYNTNSKKIKSDLRINTEKDFLNMINAFKNLNCDLRNDYEKCKFSENENKIKIDFSYTDQTNITCNIIGKKVNTFLLEF